MARQFLLRQGEDESPEYDLTDPTSDVHVIWEEMEVGGRAFRGESDAGIIPMRDERGETGDDVDLPSGLEIVSLSRGSTWEWIENVGDPDEVVMARGRIGPKDYSRGRQKADRAREVSVTVTDPNEHLQLIIVDDWVRPEETDVERVLALHAEYLDGDPRPTTVLTTTYVSSDNPVTLEAQTYDGSSPHEVLQDVALKANKNFFVTVDNELWYDAWDSTSYQAGLRISDRPDEWSDFGAACSPAGTPTVVDSAITNLNSGGAGFNDMDGLTVAEGQTVVAFVSSNGTSELTSIRYYWDGNQAGTNFEELDQAEFVDLGTDDAHVEVWVLSDAPASVGTGGLRFQFDGALDKQVYGWAVLDGAGSYVSASTSGTGTSASLSTGANPSDLVLDFLGWWQNAGTPVASTPGGSQSIVEQETLDAAFGQRDGEGALASSTGLDTVSWTLNTSVTWGLISLAFSGAPGDLATVGPIWDVGAASTEDGLDLRCGMRLYYGEAGAYVYHHDDTIHDRYWHSEESVYTSDPTITDATKAMAYLLALYARRKEEERTYNVSIGPLTEDQVGCIKYGQLIYIKARVIPDADDTFMPRRIAQLRWTTPVPGVFFARLQLSRPRKQEPYSVGPKHAVQATTKHATAGTHPASNITIIDSGGYYSANDVEAALQELGAGGGGVTVEEDDGSPSVAATTIVFDNGTVTDEGGGVARVTNSGGSGDGYKPYYDPDRPPSSGLNAVTDEFDDSSLDAAWTWTTAPGGSVSESQFPGYLHIDGGTNATPSTYYLRRAYAPGATDFAVAAKVALTSDNGNFSNGIGIALLDSSDAVIWFINYSSDGTATAMDGHRISATSGGMTATGIMQGQDTPIYLLLTRSSANVYNAYVSYNGIIWIRVGGSTVATTVAKVALAYVSDTDSVHEEGLIDFVRVFDSITRKIGA